MSIYEKYLSLHKQANDLANKCDFENYKLKSEEEVEFRNENFSKSDWEQLIAQSTGRAKYEYTRMMKERFPD